VDPRGDAAVLAHLTPRERQVLGALRSDRVVSRRELSEMVGLADHSPQRLDGIVSSLRRSLGPTAIRSVRRRGWILDDSVPT